MKKFLFLLALIMPLIALNVDAKKKGKVVLNHVSTRKDFKTVENDSIIDPHFNRYLDSFISCWFHNKTDEKVVIDWEGAKVNGGKVIFNTDRPITMDSQPKPEEAIYPHRSSSSKDITSRYKYSDGLFPLYNEKELKKGKVETVTVTIPIRIENGNTYVYDYELQYKYIEE